MGVTAHSLPEAQAIAHAACAKLGRVFKPYEVVEDVDIRTLDQHHVVPNMGPPNFKGVWFPRLNI